MEIYITYKKFEEISSLKKVYLRHNKKKLLKSQFIVLRILNICSLRANCRKNSIEDRKKGRIPAWLEFFNGKHPIQLEKTKGSYFLIEFKIQFWI